MPRLYLSLYSTTNPLPTGQCQTPGNAICWLAAEDLVVGDPCCPGSACFPHPSDSPNSFCQYLDRIPEGGFCGVRLKYNIIVINHFDQDRVGICEDGTVCIADTCTKGTTTATTVSTTTATTSTTASGETTVSGATTVSSAPTVADDCAATDAVCFSATVSIKPCCVTTDNCRHDNSDPAGTYKCHTDCIQSGGVCYDGTTPPKSCCDSTDKCMPDPSDPTKFTCQGPCMDSGETCFDPAHPTVMA